MGRTRSIASPGHHFQLSIERERTDVPPILRVSSYLSGEGFTEGWASYAEWLADEVGLNDHPAERLGFLQNESTRAARLVVDTGFHGLGWDRQKGVDTLRSVGLPEREAEVEVDRYSARPGQAVSYKIGQLALLRWRALAMQGGASLREFHERIIELGALPLENLESEPWATLSADQGASRGSGAWQDG